MQRVVAAGSPAHGYPAHGYHFTYKDSISPPVAANAKAASSLLRNCGFLAGDALAPEPASSLLLAVAGNRDLQLDGWSCGLHVVKWIELDLRRRRGEPRLPDPSIDDLRKRTNMFITRIKGLAFMH